jgi:homoserine O-acetyltransferase/O-succinyltransferase
MLALKRSAAMTNAEKRRPESDREAREIRCEQGVLALPEPFVLEGGESLSNAGLAWRCVGPDAAPLVVVLGGISAHRQCSGFAGAGWWEAQCGAGQALDIERFRLLSVDWLGGCDESTGPGSGDAFPAISTTDQARAILLLLNRLGIRHVHAIVGASYGGAVAQHLAALLGRRLGRLVLLSAAHRPSQFAVALRDVQRSILDLGENSAASLALVRALAIIGYRTPQGFEERFAESNGAVEWLAQHGRNFAERFSATAYRCLSTSLDSHYIDAAAIAVPTTVFSVHEDLLVPPALSREFAATCSGPCELVEISSNYGHDAFLKEEKIVAGVLRRALEHTR